MKNMKNRWQSAQCPKKTSIDTLIYIISTLHDVNFENNGRAPSTVGLILIQVLVHPLLQGIELQVQGAGFAEQHGVVIGGLHGKTVDLNHEAFTLPEKVRLDSG